MWLQTGCQQGCSRLMAAGFGFSLAVDKTPQFLITWASPYAAGELHVAVNLPLAEEVMRERGRRGERKEEGSHGAFLRPSLGTIISTLFYLLEESRWIQPTRKGRGNKTVDTWENHHTFVSGYFILLAIFLISKGHFWSSAFPFPYLLFFFFPPFRDLIFYLKCFSVPCISCVSSGPFFLWACIGLCFTHW